MSVLKVRISTGHTQTLRDIELLEVDGVPYCQTVDQNLASRVTLLENVLADLLTKFELISKDDRHDN